MIAEVIVVLDEEVGEDAEVGAGDRRWPSVDARRRLSTMTPDKAIIRSVGASHDVSRVLT
jgi:hypothetical protein